MWFRGVDQREGFPKVIFPKRPGFGDGWIVADTNWPSVVGVPQFGRVSKFVNASSEAFESPAGAGTGYLSSGEISIFVWTYWTGVGGASDMRIAMHGNDSAVDDHEWMIGETLGFFRSRLRIGGAVRTIIGNSTVPLNTWVHLGVTYRDGEDINVYIDAVEDANYITSGSFVIGTSEKIAIGCIPENNAQYFDGLIADLRVYDKWFSPSEVQRLYSVRDRWDLYAPAHQRNLWVAAAGTSSTASSQAAYMAGTLAASASKQAYTEGVVWTIDSQPAYIAGDGTLATIALPIRR
jgi:hypothetical protein